jgi:hypothetical protein
MKEIITLVDRSDTALHSALAIADILSCHLEGHPLPGTLVELGAILTRFINEALETNTQLISEAESLASRLKKKLESASPEEKKYALEIDNVQ